MRRRGATPGKVQKHKQPQRGCTDGSNGWHVRCGYLVDIGHSFRADSSSAPVKPIPFRPCLPHPSAGTNGTTPCGVGNALRPEPGVAPGTAQPRAVWHNVVDVGGGEMMWAMTHYVHGNAAGGGPSPFPLPEFEGRALPHRPSGNPNGIMTVGMDVDQFLHPETPPEDGPSPFPLRESQRDSAIKPGVAPPRRYPG